ncbi:ABC transporter permease [Ensifer aridi]|uniref:ABC transporter permease n=1 Tax=Ensifer aridi TaxID=1708715 RepID=UPI0006152267|nr:ABC transporter permease [Ensifer aridi]
MSRTATLQRLTRKMLRAAFTIVLLVTFVFFALRLTGDPASAVLPPDAPPEQVKAFRRLWGLDQSVWHQYLVYFVNIGQGNLGYSFLDGRDALAVVLEKLPATVLLMLAGLGLAIAIGLVAGMICAFYSGSRIDRLIMTAVTAAHAVPSYVLGVLAILVFGVHMRLLPSGGSGTVGHLIMPALTIGISGAATVARYLRASAADILGARFVRASRARGQTWMRIFIRQVLPNAAVPLLTVTGLMLGTLLGGAVVTENVFAWPGIGKLLVSSVATRDLAVVQTIVLILGISLVFTNLAVDWLYTLADPRLRTK